MLARHAMYLLAAARDEKALRMQAGAGHRGRWRCRPQGREAAAAGAGAAGGAAATGAVGAQPGAARAALTTTAAALRATSLPRWLGNRLARMR